MNVSKELQKLKALALAATPGPWRHTGDEFTDHGARYQGIESPVEMIAGHWGVNEDNAAYIAAASPDVVLALIERIEALTVDAGWPAGRSHGIDTPEAAREKNAKARRLLETVAATPPVLAAPANSAVLPTDDDPLNSQYFGKLLSRVVEYGFDGGHDDNLIDWIRAYGQACAAAERELCAKLVEPKNLETDYTEYAATRALCASAIRART